MASTIGFYLLLGYAVQRGSSQVCTSKEAGTDLRSPLVSQRPRALAKGLAAPLQQPPNLVGKEQFWAGGKGW